MISEYLDIFSRSLVFKKIPENDISDFISAGVFQFRNYSKGDLVAQAGSSCNFARIVLKGKVSGEMMDLNGKVLKIEDIMPSAMIAPAFLYGNDPRYPVNVYASENTIIWQMSREEFSNLLQRDIRMLQNYLNAISGRTQFLSEKIRFLSFPNLRSKLAGYILHHSDGADKFKMPLTHKQLSELFGVARPSLSREISALNTEGIIYSERDEIVILKKIELMHCAKEI